MRHSVVEDPEAAFRQSMQWRWWLIGVVVAIAGAGWYARGNIVMKDDADKVQAANVELHRSVEEKQDTLEAKQNDLRVINARIEVQNSMVLDQLEKSQALQEAQMARSRSAKREALDKAEGIDQKVRRKKRAISASRKAKSADPLAGLEEF